MFAGISLNYYIYILVYLQRSQLISPGLIIILTFGVCNCLEEQDPEVLLPPRNFNPHPYETGYDSRTAVNGNTGPVLFPETATSLDDDYYNEDATNAIHDHPYASVARRKKYKQAGRYQNEVSENGRLIFKINDH